MLLLLVVLAFVLLAPFEVELAVIDETRKLSGKVLANRRFHARNAARSTIVRIAVKPIAFSRGRAGNYELIKLLVLVRATRA